MFKGMIIALALACSSAGLAAGDGTGAYADSVTVLGDSVAITGAAAEHIAGDGLATILMQAASTPVFDRNGDQVGYRLTEIDAGSVFETVGIVNGDVVLEVEGMRLSDPRRAVEILRFARTLDAFDVLLARDGIKRHLHVTIGN